MRKLLALAALVLGLAACQTEPEGLDVIVGGEVDTVVSVSLPEATRANSANGFDLGSLDSTDYSLRYILEVYRVNDDAVLYDTCQRFVETSKNTFMVFPVRLAPGYDYRIVAWTDIVEGNSKEDRYYYTEEGLDNVVIKDNGTVNWNAMDETRDAYTYVKVVDNFSSASNLDMTLTRPFAKLRVVATDIDDIRRVGLVPTTATVEYSQDMYFKYNAVADIENKGAANDARAKSHTFKYTTTATQYVDNNGEYTLFTDYIFVPSTGTAKFNLTVKDADGNIINKEIGSFNTEIFVQRNKLTTIKGDVLTVGGNVKVEVDNGLGELKTINYADNAETLQEIINEAPVGEQTNITLGGDIDLDDLLNAGISSTRASEPTYGLLISEDQSIVLDLNGHTISQSVAYNNHYGMIQNNGTLTINDSSSDKNGAISFEYTGQGDANFTWGSYTIINNGTLVVNGGKIENICNQNSSEANVHMYCAIQQGMGSTTINGGVISTPSYRSVRINRGSLLIKGGNFEGQIWMQPNSESSITIEGGNFAPRGGDMSSVYVENTSKTVACDIKGGLFNTKIGMSVPIECITAGTFTNVAKEGTNESLLNSDYEFVKNGENWVVTKKDPIAMIGEVGYTSLQKAVAAVQDGDTITLVADEKFTERNRTHNSGSWYDGLYYIGDKSFTIDLGGKTISQDGSVNDYLLNFKNVGSKANTITIKNGTIDAGTTAFCALCTASSHENQLTINLENVTIYNNISNGSTAKIRGGAILNVKAGTKITGKNSYLGIECVASIVNIYDGAEIYMNGTSSYCGCLVGACGNGVVNVYGGYGKGVKGGFIAMTSGGVINVAGGEWIANTDGSVGNNSNVYVLTAQNNKKESGYAGASIINVTGGTFRGGMDAWVLNDVTVEKAELNIKGGNFNANPESYLAEGCEATENNGVWNVRVLPVAQIGSVEYTSFEEAIAAVKAGDTITLLRDITLAEELGLPAGIIFNGNGKQINGSIYAGGDLTFVGHTKVTAFSASYYNRVITIGEGACLEVTGSGRVTLGYGNTFNITGSIEDAKTTDKANIQPSLIIPGGISITGGNNATMNVNNAYVTIGNTSSKNSAANGKFTLNFTNSIAEFTNQFTLSEPTGSNNPTFEVNITNSVFTTSAKLCIAAPNSKFVVNNSIVTPNTYFRNSGEFNLTNGSVLTGKTIQFGENGGNDGTINVDNSSFTIIAGSTGHAFDGKEIGSINATNGATVNVDYYQDMTINVDESSTFTGVDVDANKKIYYTGDAELVPTNPEAINATIVSSVYDSKTGKGVITFDKDVTTIGVKAFQRETNTTPSNWITSITLPKSVKTIGNYAFAQCYSLTTINIPDGVETIGEYAFQSCDAVTSVTIGSKVANIASGAFYESYKIKEIVCKPTTPPTLADNWVFYNVEPERVVVPAASVEAYKAAWSMFADKIVAGEF